MDGTYGYDGLMDYAKKSANGDAGEYFAAYTLTKNLGWPCRLYGMDIGVDAELEVLDAQRSSTGDIIKVQIKTFDSAGAEPAVYVDDRHIDYWKRFCLPVIICCVELSTECVYWKQITATEAFRSGGASRRVTFDRYRDVVAPAMRGSLQALVHPPESKQIEPMFNEVKARFSKLPDPDSFFSDLDQLAECDELCQAVEDALSILTPVLAHFPWRISAYAQAELSGMQQSLRLLRNNMGHAHAVLINGS